MLYTKTKMSNPHITQQVTQSLIPQDTQVIDQYCKDLYLQFATIAQSFIPTITEPLETHEALYQLGCNEPSLSRQIDEHIAQQLRLSEYSTTDRFRILYLGAYIQSQIVHHYLSQEGAELLVKQLLDGQTVDRLPLSYLHSTAA